MGKLLNSSIKVMADDRPLKRAKGLSLSYDTASKAVKPVWSCLDTFFESDEWQELYSRLENRWKEEGVEIYPPVKKTFAAFRLTAFSDVKVVILGQDPYHGENQAEGLAFSVQKGVKTPPSLRNIFKEIGGEKPPDGNLKRWARQGVLLLNTVLTVEAHQANSHRGWGWEKLTDLVIEKLNAREEPIVFLLWGGSARKKAKKITSPQHLVLQSAHPSPLSAHRGFFGNNHFEATNAFLLENGQTEINW